MGSTRGRSDIFLTRNTTLNALDAYAQTWMAIHQLSYTTASEVAP
jgi:hypothetical protein